MARALRAFNAAFGAAMVLLGLALPYAFFIDTGHAPATDAFRLIQFHFVLTGAVSLLAAAGRVAAVTAVIWLMIAANGVVAALAFEQGVFWPLLLAAASGAAVLAPGAGGAPNPFEFYRALDPPAGDLPPPDYAARPEAADHGAALAAVANIAIFTALGSFVAFAGGAYIDLLIEAAVMRQPIDLEAALQNLDEGAVAGAVARLRLEIILGAAAIAVIAALGALWGRMLRERIDAVAPDFDRALSPRERSYIAAAFSALIARFGEPDARARLPSPV